MKKDFRAYESEYGQMFHLLLTTDGTVSEKDKVKFVSDHHHPKFSSVEGYPIFFDHDKEFRLAVDYVIMYPKVYVRTSIPLLSVHFPLSKGYIQ